jgi:hypothetical protein
MSKPWVAYNAQGRQIGRYAREEEALAANINLIALTVEYKPRAKNSKKEFPYV